MRAGVAGLCCEWPNFIYLSPRRLGVFWEPRTYIRILMRCSVKRTVSFYSNLSVQNHLLVEADFWRASHVVVTRSPRSRLLTGGSNEQKEE